MGGGWWWARGGGGRGDWVWVEVGVGGGWRVAGGRLHFQQQYPASSFHFHFHWQGGAWWGAEGRIFSSSFFRGVGGITGTEV